MLFKDYHIPMIRSGSKTVTRREWAENYAGPNVGTVVAAKTEMLKPDDECDCFIRITGKREEYLGEITEASARREGDYEGIEDFREGYEEVYGEGSWDDDKTVNVVEFEYVGEERPGDDTEQTTLVTDGGREQSGDRTEHTECAVCGYEPDPDRIPPHYVLSLSDEDEDDATVTSYPFGGSLSVPFACSDECWLDAKDDPTLVTDGGRDEDADKVWQCPICLVEVVGEDERDEHASGEPGLKPSGMVRTQ